MQLLNHNKSNPETRGHEYQGMIANTILSSLDDSQKQKITIKVATHGSTLPDISICHKDFPEEPIVIECKLNDSQSGGFGWVYDGSKWDYSRQSKKAQQICEKDPMMYTIIMASLNSPLVMNRIRKIQSDLGEWFPELKSNTVPFVACKEFWSTLIDKYTNEDEGGTWQIEMDESFWKSLNTIMGTKDHFLHIEGCGMFRIDGSALPNWFKPSKNFLSKIPLLTSITEAPKGNLELRLKQGGMKQRKLQQGRKLQIRSTVQPKVGQFVHVEELGSMGKNANYLSPIGLVDGGGKHATYFVNSAEAGCIGQLDKVHAISRHPCSDGCDEGESVLWVVECDLSHRVGYISFETNLRLLDIAAKSGVNLQNDSKEFISFM